MRPLFFRDVPPCRWCTTSDTVVVWTSKVIVSSEEMLLSGKKSFFVLDIKPHHVWVSKWVSECCYHCWTPHIRNLSILWTAETSWHTTGYVTGCTSEPVWTQLRSVVPVVTHVKSQAPCWHPWSVALVARFVVLFCAFIITLTLFTVFFSYLLIPIVHLKVWGLRFLQVWMSRYGLIVYAKEPWRWRQ
jgi:hypothetical protein